MNIHKATSHNLQAIKSIADANKDTLGFVTRSALQFGIQKGWLLVAEHDGNIIGFIHYRHRRDEQTTIYEICVAQEYRGHGIGRILINALRQECQEQDKAYIQLKAIDGIPANGFYEHLGFSLISTEHGRKRALNVWRYQINLPSTSSIVQQEILF